MAVYAIVECPKCGPEKLRITTYAKHRTIIPTESFSCQVQYEALERKFKEDHPVKCAVCGSILSLSKPSKGVGK